MGGGAREVAQWVKALLNEYEGQVQIPSTHLNVKQL